MKAVISKFDIYIGYFLHFFCLKNRHMFGPGFTVSQMSCDKHLFFFPNYHCCDAATKNSTKSPLCDKEEQITGAQVMGS